MSQDKTKHCEEQKRYWKKNKDRLNAQRRERRRNDTEWKKKQNAHNKAWKEGVFEDAARHAEFVEQQREYQRTRYSSNSAKKEKAAKERDWYHERMTDETRLKKRAWVHKRRTEHLVKAVELLGGKCEICSLVDDPIIYDFHHVDPSTKKFAVSARMGSTAWETLWSEIKKCKLLCSHCHRKLTHGKIVQPNWALSFEEESSSTN